MQTMSKADRFIKGMMDLSPLDKKWLFGNDTDDPLRFAFDAKRVVHPGVKGKPMPEALWQETWNALMSQKGKDTKRAAYIHIPFCQTRCLYCGFFQNFSDKGLEETYIDRLITELKMASDKPFIKSHPFNAVYIGGGTPSALSAENIERLLKAINISLPLANDCEFTFETRFHDFGNEKIHVCIDNRINRFSLGVQSFDARCRNSIGRLDDKETLIERLKYLCSINHAAVVIDLMYGLPYQTMQVWEEDVITLIESGIDGGDLYQLNVYEDSKLKQVIEKGSLPPAAKTSQQAEMFKRAVEIMEHNRMERLSICHWRNGTRERNIYNTLSKSGAVTVPFGAGAGGRLNGCTMFVDRDIKKYMAAVDRGEKPIMFMMSLPEDNELYSEITGQMDRGHLNLANVKSKFGIALEIELQPLFNLWQKKGLIEIKDNYLDLTIAGQFWYVNLTQAMLDWLVMMKGGDFIPTVKPIAMQK